MPQADRGALGSAYSWHWGVHMPQADCGALGSRACPIMLKILPIMLFSNSQYLCLLFPRKYPLFPTILSDIQWKKVILPPAGPFH